MTNRVFTGLALSDTTRGTVGAASLIPDSGIPRGEAAYTNIAFMKSIHAKSYSSIFSISLSTEEINEFFRWSKNSEFLQEKAHIVPDYCYGNDAEKHKVASTTLESLLSYSGFYILIHWSAYAKLTNTADLTHPIIRGGAVYGHYVGYKFQVVMRESSSSRQEELRDYTYLLLTDLYDNKVPYAETSCDTLGLTEDIKRFLHYNANKASMNLGYEVLSPPKEIDVNPAIPVVFPPAVEEDHGFSSGSGSSYTIGAAEETEDKDWEF